MKVRTDYKGCSYITAGKEYEAGEVGVSCCAIRDDVGDNITIGFGYGCAHLGSIGTWELLDDTNED